MIVTSRGTVGVSTTLVRIREGPLLGQRLMTSAGQARAARRTGMIHVDSFHKLYTQASEH
jgi:hypothetical protein